MNDDRDLTMLLALKDRAPFTFRWMRHAVKVKLPFRLLIADGGADETVRDVLSQPANFPSLDYEYVKYPYDHSSKEYFDKLSDALVRVETPFVMLIDHDDFCVVSGLRQSVKFLREHQEYSSCRGDVAACRVYPSERYGQLSEIYGEHVVFTEGVHSRDSLEQATALQRLESHFGHYAPTWYDVHHTEQLRAWFQILKELKVSDFYLAELLISGFAVAAGKIKRDSYPYLVRQVNTPDTYAKRDPFDRMLLETWSDDFKKFVDAMANALVAQDQMPIEKAHLYVEQLYRAYISPHIVNSLSPHKTDESRAKGGKQRLLSTARRSARKLYLLANELTGGKARKARMKFVTPVPDEEFKPIREFLAAGPTDASVS